MTHSNCYFGLASRVGAVSSTAMLLAACASTTGRGWVGEVRYEPGPAAIGSSQSLAAAIPATAEPEPDVDARPRLNHTVTLGEIDVAPSARGAGAEPGEGWGGPSVTINNYNVMNTATPAYGYGYAGVGYGRMVTSFSTGSASRTSTAGVAPGQSWPAIVDHGPSFPFHAGPASPWSRPR